MKILATADTVGGVWTYALELARAMRSRGVKFWLATMGAPLREDQWAEVRSLDNVEVFESQYKLEWMDGCWEDVQKAGRWLLDLEDRLRPDVVHLNGYCHAALPWQTPTLVVGHSCVLSWWESVKGESAPASWQRYADGVRWGIWAADLVAAPSYAMLQALVKHYGPIARTKVIYNARDAAMFEPAAEKEPMVLTAGRIWDEAKNVALLERIAPKLSWPVHVAGEETEPGTRGGGLAGGVRRLGLLPAAEMRQWQARAAIYAHPARYEPFGMSVLEAALSGCALVLGNIASLREIWGESAMYVGCDDEGGTTWAIERLIADPAMRQEMGAMARRRAMEFTRQRMAAGYAAAYESILNRERAEDRPALDQEEMASRWHLG